MPQSGFAQARGAFRVYRRGLKLGGRGERNSGLPPERERLT
jgi:hypothetical protein